MPQRHLTRKLIWLALLLAVSLLPFASSAQAAHTSPPPATIRMGVFAQSLPMLAAQAKGFYSKYNLTVQYLQVTSSTQQFQSLRDDQYDVIQTSPDNVANYRLNTSNPLGTKIESQVFVGFDYGQNLILGARPGITTVEALRGKTLAVDALTSGFAYVLYQIMRNHGLERDVDYHVITVGGTLQRYNGLLAGQFDATLLGSGFDVRAANAGYVLLDSVNNVVQPYIGSGAAAKTQWLHQNSSVAVRFVQAYYEATRWAFDPANREEAIGLLTNANTPRALAEQLYAVQLQPHVGNIRDAAIDPLAIYNVLKLRADFNGFDQPQNLRRLATPVGGVYTLTYYLKARLNELHNH